VLAQRKRVIPTADTDELETINRDSTAVDSAVIDDERDAAIRGLFDALPPQCQKLLNLLMRDPPPNYRDIADELDMPIGSIGPTRARCLKRLTALAADRGIDLGELRS
jgi:DNA-directed RNA polymerase specialized sigma24 family protein